MARKVLSTEVVAKRMVELRNLRKLHSAARARELLKDARIAELETTGLKQRQIIDTLLIQVSELQTMVFGKKKRPPTGGTPVGVDRSIDLTIPKQPRSKDSYSRLRPPSAAITNEVAVPLPKACVCGGVFNPSSVTIHERYIEDIPLPELTPGYQAHLVTKYRIQRGVCASCGKATSDRDLGGAEVSLGPNVRLLVTHLIASVGMSYAQVASLLFSMYGLSLSDGELANIVRKQHQLWLPAYNQIKTDIRAAPVRHYDETPWKIQAEDNAGYAWVMSDAYSQKTLFHCATSRGGRHAQNLHGRDNDSNTVHISDDYSAYRNLPGLQQLCWVHLYRTIRDLRYNTNLPKNQIIYVHLWYEAFAAIYQDLRHYLDEPYDEVVRITKTNDLWSRVKLLAEQPPPEYTGEPDKLRRLKAQLLRAGKSKLLVCLTKNTPCNNNRAERDLRQLVLKRRRSFGSKTLRGAEALATVMSLCTTTWRITPQNYFKQLALVG